MRIGSTGERYRPGPVRGEGSWIPSGEFHALSPGESRPLCGRAKPLVVHDEPWPPNPEGVGAACQACSQLAAVELAGAQWPVLPQLVRSWTSTTLWRRRSTFGEQQAR